MENNKGLNTTIASNNTISTTNKEESVMRNELASKKVADLRADAKAMGIKGISKMKKEELINAIVFFEELKKKADEAEKLGDEIDYAKTHLADGTPMSSVRAKREEYLNALLKALSFRIISDTLPVDKDGYIINRKDKDGKIILKSGGKALFYRPTKVEVEEGTYMVVTKRLWGVLRDETTKFCEKHDDLENVTEETAKQTIESAIDLLIKNDLLTAVQQERNWIKLDPKTMKQEEKDTLNALWKEGKISTKKLTGKDEGKILTSCEINGKVNEDGKKALNELYPCYSYRATATQMNNMFAIIKSR